MREVDELMQAYAAEPFPSSWFPSKILDVVSSANVDELMAALPENVREVVVAWLQECFASGAPTVRLSQVHYPEREAAMIDWARRHDRFHWPRRPDELDLESLQRTLWEPEPTLDAIRRDPERILRFVKPTVVDTVMATLPDDVRAAVVAWARETFAAGKELPTPRPWRARRGAEEALVDWLRRHELGE